MNKIKLLYVDDEERNVRSFKRAFRKEYEIDTATSAKEGLELVNQKDYHIVLTDQRMPDKTGVEFLSEICETHPRVMRILITAYSDIGAVINSINMGKIYKYINKPYDESELRQIFEEAYQVYQYRNKLNKDFSRYKESFIKSVDPIFLINNKGEFIDANESCRELLGLTRTEMFQTPCSHFFISKEEKRKFMSILKSDDKVTDFEAAIRSTSGVIDCLMSIKKLNYEFDNSIVYHGSLKNISPIKNATSELIQDIVLQQEAEKQQLAAVLHESLSQRLAGIKFYISTLRGISDSENSNSIVNVASDALDKAIEELRDVCFNLVPQSLTKGVEIAVEETCKRLESNFDVQIERNLNTVQFINGNSRVLFRLIQELLLYSINNSTAKNISIELSTVGNEVVFQLETEAAIEVESKLKELVAKAKSYKGNLTVKENKDGFPLTYTLTYPN